MEKRSLQLNNTNNDPDNKKNSYTFILPNNNYVKEVEIKENNKKKNKKEEPKGKK